MSCGVGDMVRLVAADIDGTLTINRVSSLLDMDALMYMRLLEENNVSVSLVSSNALPIVVGLKKYLGLTGPAIGESGALVYFSGDEYYHLTDTSARDAATYLHDRFSECIYPSWQNDFRLHDYAFHVYDRCLPRINELLREIEDAIKHEYPEVRVGYSGYAIHLTPRDVSKAKALEFIAGKLGIGLEEILAIGDSVMDADMITRAGIGVAVANADNMLKAVADIVTEEPSGRGFIEIAEKILRGEL